jgi:glycine/sarcosine N-methyltransferase
MAADMRALPFRPAPFDVVVCADNSLPHLLTANDVRAALENMRRVLTPGGLLLISTRPYDELRRTRPQSTQPQFTDTSAGRAISFQLWAWHDDEHYDVEHFLLVPHAQSWSVHVRHTTYWALPQERTSAFAVDVGFQRPRWHTTTETGFFQPVMTARSP